MNIVKSRKICLWLLFALLLSGCGRDLPRYWPVNGTTVRNIKWEIPVSDSLNVLVKQDGKWLLPKPSQGISTEVTTANYRMTEKQGYPKSMGRVDQEVVNSNPAVQTQYYRFHKRSVLLLGHATPDTVKPLILFDPPLVIFPSQMGPVSVLHESEGKTKHWNKVKNLFEEGHQNRIRLKVKESNTLIMDSTEVQALLCEMMLSSDRTVAFGETDLIVPDAVQLTGKMLIVEGIGPVLEWGIRSRVQASPDPEELLNKGEAVRREPDEFEKRVFYIEVTLHERSQSVSSR